MTEAVLELRTVTKRFTRGSETVVAVAGASMTLHGGTFTVVRGPSGSGKTTLLNLALGWDVPDEGTVTGLPTARAWTSVAVVPQRLGLLEHLTIGENVGLPVRGRQSVAAATIDVGDICGRLGLEHVLHRFPVETSLGEQQRAAVARGLVGSPRVLVADEPTSHQDDENATRITAELANAASLGAAVLVATHDARVAVHATRRYEMIDGHLRALP